MKKSSVNNPKEKVRNDSNFAEGKFHSIKVRSGSVKFSKLYHLKTWQRYAIAALIGFLMAIIVQFLIKNTGLYNTGLSAIIQGFSRLVYVVMTKNGSSKDVANLTFNLLFWVSYFVINIPLFIFAYLKIGKTFTKLTFLYLVVNTIAGFCLSEIPNISEIFLFGKTMAESVILSDKHVYVLPFYFEGSKKIFNPQEDSIKSFFLIITAIVYGFLSSTCFSMLYIIGSCTAGLDFISIYYATKKNKNISNILVIINTLSMIVGSTLGSYISGGLIDPICFSWEFFLSANLVGSFLSIVIFGLMLGRLFPLNKHVRVEIFSNYITQIRDDLFAHNYTHTLTIYKTIGGYSLEDHSMLCTICMYIELPKLVAYIRKIDPNCLIVATKVDDIDGTVNVYQQGSSE